MVTLTPWPFIREPSMTVYSVAWIDRCDVEWRQWFPTAQTALAARAKLVAEFGKKVVGITKTHQVPMLSRHLLVKWLNEWATKEAMKWT